MARPRRSTKSIPRPEIQWEIVRESLFPDVSKSSLKTRAQILNHLIERETQLLRDPAQERPGLRLAQSRETLTLAKSTRINSRSLWETMSPEESLTRMTGYLPRHWTNWRETYQLLLQARKTVTELSFLLSLTMINSSLTLKTQTIWELHLDLTCLVTTQWTTSSRIPVIDCPYSRRDWTPSRRKNRTSPMRMLTVTVLSKLHSNSKNNTSTARKRNSISQQQLRGSP